MNKVRIYPQLELLNTWAIDRTRFNPDATEPPLCLRCGRPENGVLSNGQLFEGLLKELRRRLEPTV